MKKAARQIAPEDLAAIDRLLIWRYPTLRRATVGGVHAVVGMFPVEYQGQVLDQFQVMILLPPRYPEGIPNVFEVGGRIPHDVDRHVIPSTGEACLFVSEDRWYAWPKGSSFAQFLDVPVYNYFLSQVHFEVTGKWPEGWEPRSHGDAGVFEAYRDLLGTSDDQVVLRFMWVLSHEVVKGHWPCPCGSGKSLRACHREFVQQLQARIPHELIDGRFKSSAQLRDRASQAFFALRP